MKITDRSLLFHIFLLLLVCTALYVLTFFYLHYTTNHGEEIYLPKVAGMHMHVAVSELEQAGFAVAVDSTYDPAQKPYVVLLQSPDSGAVVKPGRTVLLTVNMVSPPLVAMPNLVNLNYKSAVMQLLNNKLQVGDTVYKYFIQRNVILGQLYGGFPIKPGDMVAQGSRINLEIGDGYGSIQHLMPAVTGNNVAIARIILDQLNLYVEVVSTSDTIKLIDTPGAQVMSQFPKGGLVINEGDTVTLIAQ